MARRSSRSRRRRAGRIPARAPRCAESRRARDRLPRADGSSSPRQPVLSDSRFAARPVGAASATSHALDAQDLQDRVDQRRLADAGTAGDDEDLRSQCQPHRLALTLGKGDARFALDPRNGFVGIDRWPGQRTGRECSQAPADGTLSPMQPGEKDAGPLVDGIGDHLTILQLHLQRALDDRGWHLQQIGGHRQQLAHAAARSAPRPSLR